MALQQQHKTHDGVSAELALKKAVAASGGALVTSLFVTPLDVAKVRLQSQIATRCMPHPVVVTSSPMSMISATMEQCRCKGRCPCNRVMTRSVDQLGSRPGVLSCMRMSCSRSVTAASLATQTQIPKQHVKLSGTTHALRHIFQTEGISGLFSGLSPTMMIAVPSTVLYYISYDLLLQKGREQIPECEAIVPLLAGTTARVIAASITSPIELIRTRMQGNPGAGGIINTFHHAIRSGGYQSLLNGLVATLARDVPFSAIYWTSYERLQQRCSRMEAELSLSRTQRAFACGAISGAIAATLTTPFDVVKTLQQVKIPIASIGPNPSGAAVLKQIVATQGVRGAFTGLSARLARVTPSCAIMISCYELGKEKLGLP